MTITLEKAIEQAEKFTEGETFHAGSAGWKAVMARLLEEVKQKNPPIDPAKGCWMDDGQGCSLPDTCVIDDGNPENCVYARGLTTHGECKYWKEPACQIAEEANKPSIDLDWRKCGVCEWSGLPHETIPESRRLTDEESGEWSSFAVQLCPECRNVTHHYDEPKGPLPSAILADMIDQQADELGNIAKEIDIYNGLKYDAATKRIGAFKVLLVLFAKQLREDANK